MKVLSIVTNRYASFYEKQTAELEARGIDIDHVYPRKQSKDHGEQQSISRSYTDYLSIFSKLAQKSLTQYDLIHANNGKTAPFALLQPHRPIVLSLWGSDLAGEYRRVTRQSARFCDEVIVMSQEMKTELGQDAHVIPHGIDMNQFKPIPKSEAQEAIGWDPETANVLFPYNPDRDVKNYPLAKRIVEAVKSNLSISIELQAVYEVDHDDVPLYMNAADALLLTSRREGFPNSVKEAMACNLPVVSTDVGGVRKWIEPVENSYVGTSETELADALTTVLQSGQRSNGRAHAADLSLDAMATDIIEVHNKALNHRTN